MKLKLYTLSFIIISIVLFSCKSAQKSYQKGNYNEAVYLAAKKLAKKPNDPKLIAVIQDAYRFASEDYLASIRNLSSSNTDLRFEKIYNEYLGLQSLYDVIRRSPSVYDVVRPTDYSSYITTYQQEAANARIGRGDELMQGNNKQNYKDAFFEFERALALKPGDLSIQQRMDDAYANAVTNVIVQPMLSFGAQYSSYNFDFQNFNYDMLRYLNNNSNNRFMRYYAPSEAGSNNLRPDNFVETRFSGVNIGRLRDQRTTREVSQQVVGKEIVYSKDSVKKEYITVKAKITTTTRSLQANALLQALITDPSNRMIWSDTYQGDYYWSTTFSTYTGDERALSEEDKKLLNQKEQLPPSNNEIIRIIMNEVRSKTECGVSDYFRRMY